MKASLRHLIPLALLGALSSSLLISCGDKENSDQQDVQQEARTKVLYVTHEPGKFHDYTAQRSIFKEIAKDQPWDVTVLSATHDELVEIIAGDQDFAKDSDVIVYNICMAKELNLLVPHNIKRQTEVHGKPAMLIHCALHSFWATYKGDPNQGAVHSPGAHAKAHSLPETIAKWQADHGDKAFPAWPNYTGIASTRHSHKTSVQSIKKLKDHPIIADVPEYASVEGAELYYNFISEEEAEDTVGILLGKTGEEQAYILWEKQHPLAKVVSYTMGHSTPEWHEAPFQKVIANTINYLACDHKQTNQ